jgi:hypothetical protein
MTFSIHNYQYGWYYDNAVIKLKDKYKRNQLAVSLSTRLTATRPLPCVSRDIVYITLTFPTAASYEGGGEDIGGSSGYKYSGGRSLEAPVLLIIGV